MAGRGGKAQGGIAETLPPFDAEAEAAVIASLLVDPEAVERVAPILRPEDFFREKNGWAYAACVALQERGEPVNQITVAHELARRERLEEIGGNSYLSRLVAELPTAVGVEYYARIVAADGIRRRLIGLSAHIAQAAYSGNGDLGGLLCDVGSRLEALQAAASPLLAAAGFTDLTLDEVLADEDEPLDVIIGDGGDGAVLSADGKGFVAGPTGVGKTNLLLRLSRCLCEPAPFLGLPIEQPRRLFYVLLEGSKRGIRRRLRKVWAGASAEARDRFFVDFKRLDVGRPEDLATLHAAVARRKPDVLIIDPLRNAHSWDENASDQAARLTAILDDIITTHGCAIVCAHHDRKRPAFVRKDSGTDRVRGSTALTGWLTFCLSVETDPSTPDTLLAEWTKTRDAETTLPPLSLHFDRATLDFEASERGAGHKANDDLVLNAVFHVGDHIRGTDLIRGLVEGAGVGERSVRDCIRGLVAAGRLIEYIAPADQRTRAKSYRLPGADLEEEDS